MSMCFETRLSCNVTNFQPWSCLLNISLLYLQCLLGSCEPRVNIFLLQGPNSYCVRLCGLSCLWCNCSAKLLEGYAVPKAWLLHVLKLWALGFGPICLIHRLYVLITLWSGIGEKAIITTVTCWGRKSMVASWSTFLLFQSQHSHWE